MQRQPAFALLMAMRTGKTKTLLDDWGRLEAAGHLDDLLVIAPAGVYETWPTAAAEHMGATLAQRCKVHLWRAKENGVEAGRALARFLAAPSPRLLVLNVEALSGVARARTLAATFVRQRRCMVAVDESTVIKNHRASRTKFVVDQLAPYAACRRILSGLPTPKSPLDVFSQFYFLDPRIIGMPNYWAFRAAYAVTRKMLVGGRSIEVVVGYKNVENLQRKIAPYSFRCTLDECYDLPPKIYMKRSVTLSPEQTRAYREMKEYATTALSATEHVTATLVITQILRLHQILCGHVSTEDGRHISIPEQRTEALLELLDEHDGKAIIWCSYDADVRKVSEALCAYYEQPGIAARFWGGNRGEREDEERRFLNDSACKYMVATAAAGGRGRTWTVADLVVYYSNTMDLEHRSQSEERAQGINKTTSVCYVDLVAPGTVDEKIIKALRNKMNMAATITGDNYQEWLI